MLRPIAFCLLCGAVCVESSVVFAEPPGEKLVYRTIQGGDLHVYVSKPDAWKPTDRRPAVVFFHGGGWTGGAPGQFTEHAQYFASRGLVCFQVEYRLLDKSAKEPPESCTQDAVAALRWVRSRAKKFGIDPRRIASAGGSAGGHLAAYLGCVDVAASANSAADAADQVSAKSDAMLLFNPVYDNGPGGWGTARVGARYPEFSPLHNLSADDPPSIVFLGSKDKLIPVATAEQFRDRCQQLGIESELHVYEGQPHGFFNANRSGGRYYYETVLAADEFLIRLDWLSGQPTLQKPELGATSPKASSGK